MLAFFNDVSINGVQLSDGHQRWVYTVHDHPLNVSGNPDVKKAEPCIRCPVDDKTSCAGFLVPRFCELIDPSCPQYEPSYLQVIVRESRRLRPSDDPSTAPELDAKFATDFLPSSDRHAPGDCCGGGMALGAYNR
jgi:hypothetical protein